MKSFLQNKRVLVTGACGTIGQELVRQLLNEYGVAELVGIDNNKSELFFLEQRFSKLGIAHFFLADVRDHDKLSRLMQEIDTWASNLSDYAPIALRYAKEAVNKGLDLHRIRDCIWRQTSIS